MKRVLLAVLLLVQLFPSSGSSGAAVQLFGNAAPTTYD